MAEINLEQTFNLTFSLHLSYSFLNIHDNTKSQNLSERVFPPPSTVFQQEEEIVPLPESRELHSCKVPSFFSNFLLAQLAS